MKSQSGSASRKAISVSDATARLEEQAKTLVEQTGQPCVTMSRAVLSPACLTSTEEYASAQTTCVRSCSTLMSPAAVMRAVATLI